MSNNSTTEIKGNVAKEILVAYTPEITQDQICETVSDFRNRIDPNYYLYDVTGSKETLIGKVWYKPYQLIMRRYA